MTLAGTASRAILDGDSVGAFREPLGAGVVAAVHPGVTGSS